MSQAFRRFPWKEANDLAQTLRSELEAVAEEVVVVGGLRRERSYVGDIEFLVRPRPLQGDLFGAAGPDIQILHDLTATWGEVLKSGQKMVQVRHRTGIKVECYIVHDAEAWIPLLCIRTGPAHLGRAAVTRMKRFGYRQEDGRLLRYGEPVHVATEADWFASAGLPGVPPNERDALAAKVEAGETFTVDPPRHTALGARGAPARS